MNIIEDNCKHHGITEFVLEKSGYYRCRKCRNFAVTLHRRKRKQKLVDLFGGKCVICNYSKCVEALEFHHKDPAQKAFGVSEKGVTMSFEKIFNESKKCLLLCANCHREIEAGITVIDKEYYRG